MMNCKQKEVERERIRKNDSGKIVIRAALSANAYKEDLPP